MAGTRQRAGSSPKALPLGFEASGWLVERFVGELEGAPVHGHEFASAEIAEGLHGLFGIQVLFAHEPRWIVGADGQQRGVDRPRTPPDLGEALEVRGITRVIHSRGRTLDDEAAPEGLVGVTESTPAPVLRRNEAQSRSAATPRRAAPAAYASAGGWRGLQRLGIGCDRRSSRVVASGPEVFRAAPRPRSSRTAPSGLLPRTRSS